LTLAFLTVFAETSKLHSQAVQSMNLSPAVEWKDNFNVTTDMAGDVIDPVDPDYLDLVDDDWFFDVTEVEVGGVAAGYAAVG
jgi:hypothetical protein